MKILNNKTTLSLLIAFLVVISSRVSAEIKVPSLLSDGLVLQRDTEFVLRGWGAPGEKVTLRFKGKSYKTKTTTNGTWSFKLPPQIAGGPYEMVLQGENEIKISNILFGDVWLCSGQSNMVLPMERVKEKYME